MRIPRLSSLKYGGQYIRERDLDPLMHKNDRGASMQRKRIPKEELSALPSKSLGRERSVSRSWDPSQNSRAWRFLCANRRNNRVYPGSPMRPPYWRTNSDSRRKEFYDRRREAESSWDRGHDYGKDSDRDKDYDGKDRERDFWRSGIDRDSPGSDTGSPQQPLQGESGRSQEAHGGCAGQEKRSRPQGKTPQILSPPSAGSIKQL